MNHTKPVALILNSAHSKYPAGSDAWIQATIHAVRKLAEKPVKLLSSADPVMWDITTMLAGDYGMEIMLIVKRAENDEGRSEYNRIIDEFALDTTRTTPVFLADGYQDKKPKKLWQLRDKLALNVADIIFPVSIRPGGKLDSLLRDGNFNAEIDTTFSIPWKQERQTHIPKYDFAGRSLNPFPSGRWLIHWTRSSQGTWPGEKKWEFYRDLLNHPDRYVRSAFDTLTHILRKKMIRGSSWKLPENATAVSLTSLVPEETISLMRWRKRFVRYSFEPYGIAIQHDVLVRMGAREVQYKKLSDSSSEKNLFVQSSGEKADWTKEKEWRLPGDLRLDILDTQDYFAIVPGELEAYKLRNELPGNTINCHVLFR